jgi:hypothetical protein
MAKNHNDAHYFERGNLSHAWADALRVVLARGEAAPMIVSITGFKNSVPDEEPAIRHALDATLAANKLQSCETVSNTIFPNSLWNAAAPAKQLYDRYRKILPKLIKASRKNQRGLYFDRLTSGGPPGKENQLDFILSTYKGRAGVRRSALQLAIFDPARDHSTAAQLGFPCLQHVTIAPTEDGISLNAFYATQYIVERAYGNYLGLCRLGRFVAHELSKPLVRMTCFTGISLHDTTISKANLKSVLAAIDAVLGTP